MLLANAQNISKTFGSIVALQDLSFDLQSGEILGLLGPNGAGKTTAIHILLGLLTPSSGQAQILGHCPLKDRSFIAPQINYSSANTWLPTNLKVMENLKTYARLYNVSNRQAKIDELVETFDLTHLINRITGVLSSGERTRLNLCKSFLNDPKLLLLDEPTASLDPEVGDTVRKIIKRVQQEKNMGILYTSHDMDEVEELCDRIIFIHRGSMIAQGTVQELLQQYQCSHLEEIFIKIVREQKKK